MPLLTDLAQALHASDPLGGSFWFDRVERSVVALSLDPYDLDGRPAPAWAREEHACAARIAADPDRWRRIEPTGDPGRLGRFMAGLADPTLRDALEAAARGGRGAHRRVRTALRARGLEDLWHRFEAQADERLARAWLAHHGEAG